MVSIYDNKLDIPLLVVEFEVEVKRLFYHHLIIVIDLKMPPPLIAHLKGGCRNLGIFNFDGGREQSVCTVQVGVVQQ